MCADVLNLANVGCTGTELCNPLEHHAALADTDPVLWSPCVAAGTVVLGYVYTQYGKRDPALVQADIAR